MRDSAAVVRNKQVAKSHLHIMLCGKVKAYADILNMMQTRYRKRMNLPR